MLASITPFGERSRGFSWPVTAGAFAAGAIVAGTVCGALLGVIGSLLPGGAWRAAAVLAAVALALTFDGTRLRLPSSRRQVNEDWIGRYRGWVYGSAFGAQLGVGVATIVTSAAVYLAAVGALLCGSAAAGAAIGGAFGLTRALSLVPAGAVTDAGGLTRLHRRLVAGEALAQRLVVLAELAAAAVLVAVVA